MKLDKKLFRDGPYSDFFSQGVQVGNILTLAGQLGDGEDGEIPESIKGQMENWKSWFSSEAWCPVHKSSVRRPKLAGCWRATGRRGPPPTSGGELRLSQYRAGDVATAAAT